MRRAALLLLAVAAGACAGPVERPAPVVRGPLPVRNQHPLGLTQLALLPRTAAVQPRGTALLRVASAYSSIYEVEDRFAPTEEVRLDGEIWRTAVGVRFGVTDASDLEVALPFVYTTSGFLDDWVDAFHDAFWLPDAGRETSPEDQWRTFLVKDGRRGWEMEEDRLGLGDVPIVYTHALAREADAGVGVALRAAVELPVGDESAGFGNGAVDVGGGVVAERSAGRWTLTGGASLVRATAPSDLERAGVELRDLFGAHLGGEMRWSDRTSLLLGLVYTSPLTKDLDAEEIASGILDLGIGAAWSLSERSRLALSFHEDLISKAGPDFALYVVWSLEL